MQAIKGYSAKEIIKRLRTDSSVALTSQSEPLLQFNDNILSKRAQAGTSVLPRHIFQSESYDRIIRDKNELLEKIEYIFNNPIKKGLTINPIEYEWYYLNPELEI